MPPRYAYWTILAGGLPTSFRAALREDLLPTLRRLQTQHPDAELKWFARGKLWASPEAASVRQTEPRGREWRPGGEHRDPRERFAAAKRERNQARRKARFERKRVGAPDSAHPSAPKGTASTHRRSPRDVRHHGSRARGTSKKRGPRK